VASGPTLEHHYHHEPIYVALRNLHLRTVLACRETVGSSRGRHLLGPSLTGRLRNFRWRYVRMLLPTFTSHSAHT
jgi:hypothetical protein